MNKDKSTKKQATTQRVRTRKSALPEMGKQPTRSRQTKARILSAGEVSIIPPSAGKKAAPTKNVPVVPKSVEKLATAKTLAPKHPLGRPAVKKPAVDVAQLQKSLRNAEVAKAANEKVVKKLESELKDARAENRVLKRTVERLQSVIDELKAEKAVRGSWLRRLFRRQG